MINISIKNYLGAAGIITLLALSYAGIRFGNSSDSQPYRTFSVQAEGEVIAVPDVARFTFSVLTEGDKDLSKLQEENTTKANAIIDFLKESGVDKKDIKTNGYSVSPRYQYYDCGRFNISAATPCPPPEIVGYSITQSVLVTARDMSEAGAFVSGAVAKGANSVSGISFEIDDETALQNEAREKALLKARAQALATAKAGNFRLGKIVSINESFYSPQFYGKGGDMMMGISITEETPTPTTPATIEPGSKKITVSMYIQYEIK